jgi:shikimate kinase
MKSNLTLIGMPGAGKSTIGIILAKNLAMGFIDTDVLIQINHQKSLQQIMDESGHLQLRKIEEGEILKLNIESHVIATGGSAVYSDAAMTHLAGMSTVVFLDVDLATLKNRIHNYETRGIAKAADQSFRDLFEERRRLYKKYAQVTVDAARLDQERLAALIANSVPG